MGSQNTSRTVLVVSEKENDEISFYDRLESALNTPLNSFADMTALEYIADGGSVGYVLITLKRIHDS